MASYKIEKIKVPRFEEANGFYTTPDRSNLMSRIRAKNTKPEIAFRKVLWACGFRYRLNYKRLPGQPDMVSKKHRLAIFIDGSFWHGYEWDKRKESIKANRGFWIPKIERNMQRDQEVNHLLAQKGYTVLRFWDFEIKKTPGQCLKKVLDCMDRKPVDY